MPQNAHGPLPGSSGPSLVDIRGQRIEAQLPQQAAFLQAAQRDLRFRHDVERLHRLGPRPLYELLAEIGARWLTRTDIEEMVGRYAAIDPEMLHAAGADRMPPLPLRVVP